MARRKYMYHGSERYKTKHYNLAACAAACSTLDLNGSAAEIHVINTASTGCGTGADINLNIVTDHAGPQWIVWDSNNACDTACCTIDVLVNGTAIADTSYNLAANDERLIVINIASLSPLLVAGVAADNLD